MPDHCNPTNSFILKTCLFATNKLTRSVEKSKFTYNVQGIAFDRKKY